MRGERCDGVESEVCRFLEEGGWEGKTGVGIFVRFLVESRSFLLVCSDGSLVVRTMDV